MDSLWEPMAAFAAVGILALLLRWAFAHNRSLIERRPRSGTPGDYGLLVRVAAPTTFIEAEQVRLQLVNAGLRATLAPTSSGPAVLVFPADEAAARALLR